MNTILGSLTQRAQQKKSTLERVLQSSLCSTGVLSCRTSLVTASHYVSHVIRCAYIHIYAYLSYIYIYVYYITMYIYEKFNAPKAAAPQMLFTSIPHRPTSYASLLAMGECNACRPLCQWTHGHTRTTQDALSSPTTWWDEGTVGGGKLYSQQLVKSHHKLPTSSSLRLAQVHLPTRSS